MFTVNKEIQLATPGISPYMVVYSLFGSYVLPRGGEIWIGSLIQALAAIGFSEQMVRTTISRMKQAGFVESLRAGLRSFYRLTDLGVKEVQSTSERAFTFTDSKWEGSWTMITYSVPEEHRELRDSLRALLKTYGFGSLVPGAWISPRSLPTLLEQKCQKIGVWRYLEVFTAEHIGPSDLHHLVEHAWPHLSAIAGHYQSYQKKYDLVIEQVVKEAPSNRKCFALHMQSLFELIAIILEDPGLPTALLPEDWPSDMALSRYEELQNRLAEPAERFFDEIFKTNESPGFS
jgi:phenylacetic acid degradation operon negative regulatory protein